MSASDTMNCKKMYNDSAGDGQMQIRKFICGHLCFTQRQTRVRKENVYKKMQQLYKHFWETEIVHELWKQNETNIKLEEKWK